jgi:hypothetical protein
MTDFNTKIKREDVPKSLMNGTHRLLLKKIFKTKGDATKFATNLYNNGYEVVEWKWSGKTNKFYCVYGRKVK